jgi:hypothetical protein
MRNIFSKDPDPKPTSKKLLEATIFAKDFARKRHHIMAEETHVGNQVPKFINTATGKEMPQNYTSVPMRQISQTVPKSVKELEWDSKANLPYYLDEQSGDIKYVNRDLFYTDRFQPRRNLQTSILDYAKR